MSSEQLATVRALVATGLSVIPLPRPDAHHDGKRPTFPWSEYQQRLPTEAELHAWFAGEPRNLAVVTGAVSGIVVVDADSAEAEAWCLANLPETPWRVRTARGLHLYYQHPGPRVGNRARLEVAGGTIDLRGDGGYVVGPGSQHASGAAYRPEGDWNAPKDRLPQLPLDALPAAPVRAYSAPVAPTRDAPEKVLERARAYAAACDPAIEGQGGDNQTFLVCCRLARGFDLSEEQTLDVLREWNQRCRPPWDLGELRVKVRSALKNGDEPIGGRRDEPLPPTAPPVKLGGRVLGTGPGGGLHPDHPAAEREPVTAAAVATTPAQRAEQRAAAEEEWLDDESWIEPASAFLEVEDEPDRFLVDELLPEEVLCLIHGDPRASKSLLSIELAVAMCTGTPAFGWERFKVPQAVPVLYSTQEDGKKRVRKRLRRMLAGRGITQWPENLFFSVHKNIDLDDPRWQAKIIRHCRARGIKAIVLDPIRRYSQNVDKGPAEVRQVTRLLREIVVELSCAIVVVHHDVKPGKDPDNRRRGQRASGGDWFAACEAPIHMEWVAKDRRLVVPEDYKFSADPDRFVFEIRGRHGKVEDPFLQLVAAEASADDAETLMENEKALDVLRRYPGKSEHQLAALMKKRKDVVKDILSRLFDSGLADSMEGPRKANLWFLTEDRDRVARTVSREGREVSA